MTRAWALDYARTPDGYEALCPYCHATGRYTTLSDAVRSGVKHAEVCGDPIHPA